MQVYETPGAVRRASEGWRAEGLSVGLVPTMGALHEGHLSLVERAAGCDRVVASVFVNPTQFGAGEDFERYPRDLKRDAGMLSEAGCDALFAPDVGAMYGAGGTDLLSGERTFVEVGRLGEVFEGAARPGHFRGVATVVAMLLLATRPHRAYFGEKDYQQLLVLKKMVRELHFGVEVVGCPIVREPDGLALSSRNAYLSSEEREAATALFRALETGRSLHRDGVRKTEEIEAAMMEVLLDEPLVRPDYAAVVDAESLAPLERLGESEARALVAATVGRTRLIDNAAL